MPWWAIVPKSRQLPHLLWGDRLLRRWRQLSPDLLVVGGSDLTYQPISQLVLLVMNTYVLTVWKVSVK